MCRPQTLPGITVKELVKQDQVLKMLILGKAAFVSVDRSNSVLALEKQPRRTCRKSSGNVTEVHPFARPGRVLHCQISAIVLMELLKRLNDQVIERHPDWPAPVGVAAVQPGLALGRLITSRNLDALVPKYVG